MNRFASSSTYLFRLTLLLFVAAQLERAHCALLTNGFAHNDYLHERPLFDALDRGFCGVEADIHLVNVQLLVGHDAESLKPERTLAALYLDPLQKRVRENHGKVYPKGPDVLLLIDIKTEAEPTYAALRPVLSRYADMLTSFTSNNVQTKAVTVILSGNRPIETVAKEPNRLVAIDGRVPDLEQNPPLGLMPLISDNWSKLFQWKGTGPLAEPDKLKLEQLLKQSHEQKRKLRLWAAPDTAASWRLQQQLGIDWINTDKLADFAAAAKR